MAEDLRGKNKRSLGSQQTGGVRPLQGGDILCQGPFRVIPPPLTCLCAPSSGSAKTLMRAPRTGAGQVARLVEQAMSALPAQSPGASRLLGSCSWNPQKEGWGSKSQLLSYLSLCKPSLPPP